MRHTLIKEPYEELAFVSVAGVERDGLEVYDIRIGIDAEHDSHQGGDLIVLMNLTHGDLVEIQKQIAEFLYKQEQLRAGLPI